MFRILVGLYAVLYLLIRLPAYLALTERAPTSSIRWGARTPEPAPPDAAVVLLLVGVLLLGLAFTAGVAFRWTGPAFALGLLVPDHLPELVGPDHLARDPAWCSRP